MFNPPLSKPVEVSDLYAKLHDCIRVIRTDFRALGISEDNFGDLEYSKMQAVGAAAALLKCRCLIVPSARWDCDNIVIFANSLREGDTLEVSLTNKLIDGSGLKKTYSPDDGVFVASLVELCHQRLIYVAPSLRCSRGTWSRPPAEIDSP